MTIELITRIPTIDFRLPIIVPEYCLLDCPTISNLELAVYLHRSGQNNKFHL